MGGPRVLLRLSRSRTESPEALCRLWWYISGGCSSQLRTDSAFIAQLYATLRHKAAAVQLVPTRAHFVFSVSTATAYSCYSGGHVWPSLMAIPICDLTCTPVAL